MSSRPLDACGGCEGIAVLTPEPTGNRPGLPALGYRAGTHGSFKSSMLARLSARLRQLTTRSDDDFSVALIDAWATVADVLTFYQERIANETYLRTAVEHRSILELARLIGYELSPGVAAEIDLAFTLDTAPGAPARVVVPAGTRAQSVPGDGELPQPFETGEELVGHPEWSALTPRTLRPQTLRGDATTLYLSGIATGLGKGDWLLLRVREGGALASHPRQVRRVEVDAEGGRTRVELVGGVEPEPTAPPELPGRPDQGALVLSDQDAFEDKARELATDFVLHAADVGSFAALNKLPEERLGHFINALDLEAGDDPEAGVFALRVRAAPFGHNAPRWKTLPLNWRFVTEASKAAFLPTVEDLHPYWQLVLLTASVPYPVDWDDGPDAPWPIHRTSGKTGLAAGKAYRELYQAGADQEVILLERTFPDVVPGSWMVLRGTGSSQRMAVFRVAALDEVSASDFGSSAQVTRLVLEAEADGDLADVAKFDLRATAILAQSEKLELAGLPETAPVTGTEIELDRMLESQLRPGQRVAVSGELAATDRGGVRASEVLAVSDVRNHGGRSTLVFDGQLANLYRRSTVTINANVAPATHGETRRQVLGSGDAGRAFQRFELLQSPLTWLSAPVAAGVRSSLELRVDGVRWHPAPRFFGLGAEERRFVLQRDAEGRTAALFGDGENGARLPSGAENVTARYRTGIGRAGLVAAAQVSILASRPLGVQEVINPTPSRGAEDPETLAEARRNAPCTVLTLERVVSLQDFADFARCFPGIAKAHASWVWDGEDRIVLLTVAGVDGAAVEGGLLANLVAAMDAARDPYQTVKHASYRALTFDLEARLHVHPDHPAETVRAAVEERLRATFAFDARDFAQPVARSEVYSAIQGVDGVEAVDLDALHFSAAPPSLAERLPARPARFRRRRRRMRAAELLTLGSGVRLEALA